MASAWLQRAFPNAHARITFRKSLRWHVLESGFIRESRSKTPLFSRFKMHFKSLIWKSFAFTRAKIRKGLNHIPKRLSERAESRSVFRNVIRSHVNRPKVCKYSPRWLSWVVFCAPGCLSFLLMKTGSSACGGSSVACSLSSCHCAGCRSTLLTHTWSLALRYHWKGTNEIEKQTCQVTICNLKM